MWNKASKCFLPAVLAVLMLSGCTDHIRDPIGRYLAPPVPLTADDVIILMPLSDFETTTNYSRWFCEDDHDHWTGGNPGNSTWFLNQITGIEELYALRMTYTLGSGYEHRFVNVGIGDNKYIGSNGKDLMLDVSAYDGIHFWLKGSTNELRLKISTLGSYYGPYPCTETSVTNDEYYNWDIYQYHFEQMPEEWTEYFILFDYLHQQGWGIPTTFKKKHVTRIFFETASLAAGETGYVAIDDVSFFVLK